MSVHSMMNNRLQLRTQLLDSASTWGIVVIRYFSIIYKHRLPLDVWCAVDEKEVTWEGKIELDQVKGRGKKHINYDKFKVATKLRKS